MSQDIYFLADKFQKLAEFESKSNEMFKFAGRENRKAIEKKLQQAKIVYDKYRLALQDKKRQYEDLASVIDHDTKQMSGARDYMRKAYDVLKNMDLIDANEVRMMSGTDDVGYIKKNRVYRLKLDESGNVELEPFKKKHLPEEEGVESSEEHSEDELDADDLLASLVD